MQQSKNLTPAEAAKILGVSPQYVRVGLQKGVLPIGSAVKMSSRWAYNIPEAALKNYIEYGGKMQHELTEPARSN